MNESLRISFKLDLTKICAMNNQLTIMKSDYRCDTKQNEIIQKYFKFVTVISIEILSTLSFLEKKDNLENEQKKCNNVIFTTLFLTASV